MQEINLIMGLVADARQELERLQTYKEAERRACETGDNEELWMLRVPSKQRIRDDLRVVRRLSLDLERKLDEI